MDHAISYQHITDHAYESADRLERAIRSIESEARSECGEFFDLHTDDVWDEIIEHRAVTDAVAFAHTSKDATEIGSKLIRAIGMARIKFVNDHWTGWARWSVENARNNEDYSWPRTRRDYLDAIALAGEL